jgi:Na+/H+-dicarboxylate symporter
MSESAARKKMGLHWQILIGLAAGVVWAVLGSVLGWSQFTIDWVAPFGTIFVRLLKLLAVPLVFFSIIMGVSSLGDIKRLGRLGGKTLGLYLLTTLFATALGLLLVNTVQPGNLLDQESKDRLQANVERQNSQLGFESQRGQIEKSAERLRAKGPLQPYVDMFLTDNLFRSMTNNREMLHVIFFALFFGVALALIDPEKSAPLKRVFAGVTDVVIRMIFIVMRGAPFFVFALLAGQVAQLAGDDPGLMLEVFKGLLWFSLTTAAGLLFLMFVFYPTMVRLVVRKIPFGKFLARVNLAQAVAFSTSSSAATLPVTMEVVNKRLGVSRQTTDFVLPIGATVNMDGTSLHQAVCAVFLAQFFGVDLGLTAQITIVLTATLASIGAPAVPSAGMVMLIIVLESVGMDGAWIALVFPVDRILDMIRTAVNVTGDATVATIVAHSEGELDFDPEARFE